MLLQQAGGGGDEGAENGVELTISTLGCAAAPVFRNAALEDCRVGVSFLDSLVPKGELSCQRGNASRLGGGRGGGGGGLMPGTVLELYGASGSGKTEVALNAVCGWVLPKALGGVGGVAVIVDLDFRVDVRRLRCLLLARIRRALATTGGASGAGRGIGLQNGQQTHQNSHESNHNDDETSHPSSFSTSTSLTASQHLTAALQQIVLARCMDELEAFSVLETLKFDLDKGPGAGIPTLLVLDSLGSLFYERKAAESCQQGQTCFDFMVARCVGRMAAARAVAVLACKPALFAGARTVHQGGRATCTRGLSIRSTCQGSGRSW